MLLALTAACSDESIDSPTAVDSRAVSFSVSEGGNWSQVSSRSGATGSVIRLSSNDEELFLHPTVAPGISLLNPGRSVSSVSRGSLITAEEISSFGVFASLKADNQEITEITPDYMYNVEITAANSWKPADEYLWPGVGSLHINAYSPFCQEPGAEGITRLPSLSDNAPLSLDFTVPSDVASQIDLIYATPVNGTSSPCNLTFNHALTAIRFATGAEMAPCTVKSISISGVASSGTLDLEDGTWVNITGNATYEVTPNLTLQAAAGSKFAAANTPITSGEETFIMIPQTLPDDATITLTIIKDGKETTFTASIGGTTWTEGTTLTYHLSANPLNPGLLLEVVDANGNALSQINSKYTGGESDFKVRSFYDDGSGSGATTPIEWTATLLDSNGNPLSAKPDWIKSYTLSGNGETEAAFVADIKEPLFLAMSDNTRTLRNTADINTTSGYTTYNLSNSTGALPIENTANSYVINAPGHYSIPLVYGNAIKGGATNTAAYVSTLSSSRSRTALLHFINHLGNPVTDPYIYNNASCTPHDAQLKWEDRLNLVRNIALSPDGHSIVFDIPAASICQGNAMIAVTDASGTVMWSWHIWVTDYKMDQGYLPVPLDDGRTSYIAQRNIGAIAGGDRTKYESASAILRITQTNVPDGLQPLTIDIPVNYEEKIIETGDCYAFYQFGRKDPIATGLDQYYDGNHTELSGNNIPKESVTNHESHTTIITKSIREPEIFFVGSESNIRSISPYYVNLWDIDQIHTSATGLKDENEKTIYDPSPVGAKVPVGNVFITLCESTTQTSYNDTRKVKTFNVGGNVIEIPALGYRSANGGETGTPGSGECWTSVTRNAALAQYLSVSSDASNVRTNLTLYGFAVRPVKE